MNRIKLIYILLFSFFKCFEMTEPCVEELHSAVESENSVERPVEKRINDNSWRHNKDVEPEAIDGYKWIFSEKAGWRKFRKSDTPVIPKREKKKKITYLFESDSEEEEFVIMPKAKQNISRMYDPPIPSSKELSIDEENERYWQSFSNKTRTTSSSIEISSFGGYY